MPNNNCHSSEGWSPFPSIFEVSKNMPCKINSPIKFTSVR